MKLWLVDCGHYDSGEMYSSAVFRYLVAAETSGRALELVAESTRDMRDEGFPAPMKATEFQGADEEGILTG